MIDIKDIVNNSKFQSPEAFAAIRAFLGPLNFFFCGPAKIYALPTLFAELSKGSDLVFTMRTIVYSSFLDPEESTPSFGISNDPIHSRAASNAFAVLMNLRTFYHFLIRRNSETRILMLAIIQAPMAQTVQTLRRAERVCRPYILIDPEVLKYCTALYVTGNFLRHKHEWADAQAKLEPALKFKTTVGLSNKEKQQFDNLLLMLDLGAKENELFDQYKCADFLFGIICGNSYEECVSKNQYCGDYARMVRDQLKDLPNFFTSEEKEENARNEELRAKVKRRAVNSD